MTAQIDKTLHRLESATKALHEGGLSWRAIASKIGIKHGQARFIGLGAWEHVSWEVVRKAHAALLASDPGEIVQTLACPSCGDVHTGDCHGKPILAVVTLAPGERVVSVVDGGKAKPPIIGRKVRKPEAPCYRPRLSLDPAKRLAQLDALTLQARRELLDSQPSNAERMLALLDEWMNDPEPVEDVEVEPFQLREASMVDNEHK